MSLKKYIDKIPDFSKKKIVITGCTAGIGKEAAMILAKKNADIVILARNEEKALKTKEMLLSINPNINVDFIKFDQSDYESIDNAVKELLDKHQDFYALVANAGILYPSKGIPSKQGYPLTIDTNFLGLRRFLDQIIDKVHDKRFILQGSLVAGLHISKKADVLSPKNSLFKQYNISKAGVESLWYSYAKETKDNSFILVEPGITSTDLLRQWKQPIKWLGTTFVRIFSHSPKKASLTIIKGLEEDSNNFDYYVPKHVFTAMGYPKKKEFPKRRIREYLLHY